MLQQKRGKETTRNMNRADCLFAEASSPSYLKAQTLPRFFLLDTFPDFLARGVVFYSSNSSSRVSLSLSQPTVIL